ncbi:putative cyclin-dependent serine/threonine-protein kinase DDB_G0272797/DDB_G0274007 [Thrips palmi]|uniref:Cyclin-dependent serine/threonine-protein kinase DDB_G0272797/DDB_G0274007 n=1 Tax=Thrips palmi TaxID=161013 RepID=A0A6P8ZCW4_THRPL|nr:putative cyclin-dependent serine/threonine-protein kinase DDB_G0272797/DDB_G0274007 [Thrips palmi]
MDVLRERELKESLERQLMDETRTRMLWQKRLQKERKARRRLQEQLELEMKRRAQLEDALRGGNDVVPRELDLDRKSKPGDQQKLEPQPEVPKQGSPSPQPQHHQLHHHGQHQQQQQLQQQHQQQHQQQQQQQQLQQQKHQQTSPVPDRERQSPAVLDSRASYYKNSVLFGGAS